MEKRMIKPCPGCFSPLIFEYIGYTAGIGIMTVEYKAVEECPLCRNKDGHKVKPNINFVVFNENDLRDGKI